MTFFVSLQQTNQTKNMISKNAYFDLSDKLQGKHLSEVSWRSLSHKVVVKLKLVKASCAPYHSPSERCSRKLRSVEKDEACLFEAKLRNEAELLQAKLKATLFKAACLKLCKLSCQSWSLKLCKLRVQSCSLKLWKLSCRSSSLKL